MNKELIKSLVKQALREDKAALDITSSTLIKKSSTCTATIITKQNGVISGLDFAKYAFILLDKTVKVKLHKKDGDKVSKNTVIATVTGKTKSILSSERTALNFLGYLSGISTNTYSYVSAVNKTKAKILDTRKTTPTLRTIEKFAVKCGGGVNHRSDLNELVLIKDNHRAIYQGFTTLANAILQFRRITKKQIEIEVDTLKELKDALKGKPDLVLLDNMNIAQMRRAVAIVKQLPKNNRPLLEASGGITLKNVASVAKTGVDRISIGALTHTHKNLDVSLEITADA